MAPFLAETLDGIAKFQSVQMLLKLLFKKFYLNWSILKLLLLLVMTIRVSEVCNQDSQREKVGLFECWQKSTMIVFS